jgi:AcrR family transcriptional regulator
VTSTRRKDPLSRTERKDLTRASLLQAALDLMGEGRSFTSLGIREIAREAGMVPNAFYRHFRNTDELGLALVEEVGITLRRLLREARQAGVADSKMNTATACASAWAWFFRLCAAAAACSTSAAFCCVTWSIWVTASVTRPMPELCWTAALEISPIRSDTFFTCSTMDCIAVPASPAWCAPRSTRWTDSSIRALISRAASPLRLARPRTSEATTAKPRPCSPARAASTAALSARMLVWKAMPSMTPMMSAMRGCWR